MELLAFFSSSFDWSCYSETFKLGFWFISLLFSFISCSSIFWYLALVHYSLVFVIVRSIVCRNAYFSLLRVVAESLDA